MTTIALRADYPNGLTNAQIDANFSNLNNDKVEVSYLANTFSGTTNIKTVGAITTGTWSASTIAVNRGGTGTTTSTGTGSVVLNNSPTLLTPSITGNMSVDGNITAIDVNTLSDVSLKTNISSIENSVSILSKINGVEFDWKSSGKKSAGVIAQEVQATLPHLVNVLEDNTLSVNYAGLIAYLIEAVKAQQQEIEDLKTKISLPREQF
jgi:hypothetical protein